MSAPQQPVQLPRLSILQEDDEFEEFPVEDWQVGPANASPGALHTEEWQEGWDDDFDAEGDFGKQLREEIAKRATQQ